MESHAPIIHASDHNFASFTPEERAAQEIESALEQCRARWKQLQAGIANAPAKIENETTAENFTTVIAQIQALLKRIEQQHDDVKEPYLLAGRKVDAVSFALAGEVLDARDTLQRALTVYQVEKQRRIDEERERIRQLEAEDPMPTYVPPSVERKRKTRIRSVEGASAHLVETVDMEILDIRAIPDRYLQRPKVLAALRAEILPDVRKGDTIEGVKRIDGMRSQVKA